MKIYNPAPGSATARVIAHLTIHGGTLRTSDISALFGLPVINVDGTFAHAKKHGLLTRAHDDEGRVIYSLGNCTPAADADATATSTPRKKTLSDQAREFVMGTARKPRATPPPAPEPADPIAALYSDGDVVVYGGRLNDTKGGAHPGVTLTDAQAHQLHAFLSRVCRGPVIAGDAV